ncbi:MAG: hypothetical protein EFT35_05135 [Methanophagales archaeon ANME-1-THS]|nr:MAG: hypothetical protein EFT35_05135 [Methanophagales archaeon ANME-1-THS]
MLEEEESPDEKNLDDKIAESISEIDREEQVSETKEVPRRIWTPAEQKVADDLELSKLINKGIFFFTSPFCKSKKLKEEDLQEINLGGGIVGLILYYVPDANLNHPIIIIISRVMLFIVKFRAICSQIAEKVQKIVNSESYEGPTEAGRNV